MKKSTIYHKAAVAVMNDTLQNLTYDERLEILQQLMEDENVAKFVEERDAKEAAV